MPVRIWAASARWRHRVDGGWSVTGQKVWTSSAGVADYALLMARSDPSSSGRVGISCFALDMHDPGVTVRPLRQMSGAYHFNEVFLDAVFVPEDGLIGGLAEGWSVLRTMLASERAAIGGGTSGRGAMPLVALAQKLGRSDEPAVRAMVVQAVIRERVLDLLGARVAAGAVPAGGSVSKLLYSDHARLTADAGTKILGAAATVVDDDEMPRSGWIACSSLQACGSVAAPTRSSATRSGNRASDCRASPDRRPPPRVGRRRPMATADAVGWPTIPAMIEAAERFGDQLAVVDGDRRLTYGELVTAAREFGAALGGVGRRSPVTGSGSGASTAPSGSSRSSASGRRARRSCPSTRASRVARPPTSCAAAARGCSSP